MEEKKKRGGAGRGQGKKTLESKGLKAKVKYHKRLHDWQIPIIDTVRETVKEHHLQALTEFLKTLT